MNRILERTASNASAGGALRAADGPPAVERGETDSLRPATRAAWRTAFESDAEAQLEQAPEADFDRRRLVLARGAEGTACAVLRETQIQQRLAGTSLAVVKRPALAVVGSALVGSRDARLSAAVWQAVAAESAADDAVLVLRDVVRGSPAEQAVRAIAAGGFRGFSPGGWQPRWRIRLPATAEQYWERFSSKTRNTFRRKQKKLAPFDVERITRAESVPGFLEQAHAVSLRTWQTERLGLRIDVDPRTLARLTFFAEQGGLRAYLLRKAGEPIAFLVGAQHRGVFRYEEVGYAREFHELSPGLVLLTRVLDDLWEHDRPDWFDFGEGDADYKRMFATEESSSGCWWLFPPGWGNRWDWSLLHALRGAETLARRVMRRTGLLQALRRHWRRRPVRRET